MIFANSPNVPLFNFEGWRSSSEKETTAPRQSKQEVVGRWEHLLPNLWSHPFLPPSFFIMDHQVSQVQKKARIYFTWISELFLLGDLKTLRACRNACWILRRHNANCQHIGIPRKGFLAVTTLLTVLSLNLFSFSFQRAPSLPWSPWDAWQGLNADSKDLCVTESLSLSPSSAKAVKLNYSPVGGISPLHKPSGQQRVAH